MIFVARYNPFVCWAPPFLLCYLTYSNKTREIPSCKPPLGRQYKKRITKPPFWHLTLNRKRKNVLNYKEYYDHGHTGKNSEALHVSVGTAEIRNLILLFHVKREQDSSRGGSSYFTSSVFRQKAFGVVSDQAPNKDYPTGTDLHKFKL